MLSKVSEKIAEWSLRVNARTDIDLEFIQYGIQVLLETIIKVALMIIIGVIIGRPIEMLLGIALFMIIKVHAGGKHAKTNIKCFIVMTLCVLTGVLVNGLTPWSPYIIAVGILISNFIFLKFAPNGNQTLAFLTAQEIKRKKISTVLIADVFWILALSGWNSNLITIIILSICTLNLAEIERSIL